MLHDMFDLLGLPLYNTGLSLYHLWSDDNVDNDDTNDDFEGCPPVTALHIKTRWKKKHRKASVGSNNRSNSANSRTRRSNFSK